MSANSIDYNKIEQVIKNNFLEVMDNDEKYNFYKDYKIKITREQQFIKTDRVEPKTIYIVLKFSPASINFEQTVLPITIEALSEANNFETCQQLMLDFSTRFNLERTDDKEIWQIYETPVNTANYQKASDAFRSLIAVSGTLVISSTANFYEISYNKNGVAKPVNFISASYHYDAQPDTQGFYEQNNFTRSKLKLATITITLTAFVSTASDLINDILPVILKLDNIDKDFNLTIEFSKNRDLKLIDNFKLVSFNTDEKIADIPVAMMSFTN